MAAASNIKCAKIQNKIESIELKLKEIFSNQDNEEGELNLFKISKKTGQGNVFPIYFTRRHPVKKGIYLITLNLPGNSSHGILLFISQNNNGQYIFNLFEPNGQLNAQDPSFYQLQISDSQINYPVITSLSPTQNINGSGNCGVWGIIISILLNALINQELTEVQKDNFYRFLNENDDNGLDFITQISNKYFTTERSFDVNLFRNDIITRIKTVGDNIADQGDERAAQERGGKKRYKKKKIKSRRKKGKKKKKRKTKKY